MTFSKKILIVTPILWLGFVLSISFMEAWLKFQAEGVTQIIGLSIGRLVFNALNKVELFFFANLLIAGIIERKNFGRKILQRFFFGLTVLLGLQTFHLLPYLDNRAELIINGENPSSSYFHFYYVFLEIIKVIVLAVFTHHTLSKFKIDKEWIYKIKRAKLKYKKKHS